MIKYLILERICILKKNQKTGLNFNKKFCLMCEWVKFKIFLVKNKWNCKSYKFWKY